MRNWAATLLLLAACRAGSPAGEDAGDSVDAGFVEPPDDSALFDPDHLLAIDIEMDAGDWDEMRQQTRTFQSVLEGDCLGQPFASPFTDFRAEITIDGATVPITIHKKGFFGSLNDEKPSLKVIFDEDFLGHEKLTLNNANQDPSYLRQCLTYGVFADAGIVVPRCNFAHVRVNGEDLGVYVHVETINHRMIRRHFTDGSGTLYEGTLSDFRDHWVNTFDPKGDGDRADLVPVVDALELTSDTAMVAALDDVVDLDRFYTYWAMEVITGHWDGYANDKNNFYVYNDPTSSKLQFIPWGVDATFQPGRTFGGFGDATTGPNAVAAAGMMPNRLFAGAATRATFLARERQLLEDVWDEAAMHAELDRMEALIAPVADDFGDPGWRDGVDEVRAFIDGRRALLTAELDAGPTWPFELDGYPCLEVAAVVDGTFSTTYGTLGAPDPFATGSGSFTITVDGVATALTPIGATAGFDGTSQQLQIFGVDPDSGHIYVTVFALPAPWFFPWTFDVGFFGVYGAVYDYDPGTDTAVQVGSIFGTLSLAQASATAGAPVTGTFHGNADTQGSPPPAALKIHVKMGG